jgi:hypothetical protein
VFFGPLSEKVLLLRWPVGWQVRRGAVGLEVLDETGTVVTRSGELVAFAGATPDAVRAATTGVYPPTISNIIAIAAPSGGYGPYRPEQIDLAISTAYSGFRAAVLESLRAAGQSVLVAVHSGFWGCGAFGGNRVLMTLVQLLAADMAGVDRLVLHVGDPSGQTSVDRALDLAPGLADASSAAELIARIEALGLAWGVSDGN